jgi:uncharacterized BrkB/YihY/UPF0761 family membrane protein
MAYPARPPSRPTRTPISGLDLAISITALTLTVLIGICAAVLGLFSLAFLDYCPPESCSADRAFTAVATALLVAALLGVVGLAVTIARLHRRRPAWPFAVATLVLCAIVCSLGGAGYAVAVGFRTTSSATSSLTSSSAPHAHLATISPTT